MILVVVDIFSKMAILIPCKKTVTTQQTTQIFFEHVWKHYGLSTTIIFDKDAIFVGTFWKNIWKELNMRLPLLTAFHPQTYGQTKVVNHLFEQALSSMMRYRSLLTWYEYSHLGKSIGYY